MLLVEHFKILFCLFVLVELISKSQLHFFYLYECSCVVRNMFLGLLKLEFSCITAVLCIILYHGCFVCSLFSMR